MNNDFDNLNIIILTHKTELSVLEKCLLSINKNIKIFLIENSDNFINSNYISNTYKNVSIFCTGKNLGYGGGNNFGLNLVKSKYALILNPDIICDKDYFNNIKKYLTNSIDFSIIGSQYIDNETYAPAGFFNKKLKLKDAKFDIETKLHKIDWVVGCSLLINLEKFSKKSIFDENFFLFFEEFDLCKNLKRNNKNVYSSSDLIVHHLGYKSSTGIKKEEDLIKLRNWHYMWSYFYYHRKNEGYLKALQVSLGKLFRSFFKIIFFSIIFNNKKRINYSYRFLGLLNSIIGKKSFYRIKD